MAPPWDGGHDVRLTRPRARDSSTTRAHQALNAGARAVAAALRGPSPPHQAAGATGGGSYLRVAMLLGNDGDARVEATPRRTRPCATLVRGAALLLMRCLPFLAIFCYVLPYSSLYSTFRAWNEARGDLAAYYAIWTVLTSALALTAILAAALERPADGPARRPTARRHWCSRLWSCCRLPRSLRFESGWLLAPFALAVLGSSIVWLAIGTVLEGMRYAWGDSWVPAEHGRHGRPGYVFWRYLLRRSSLYAGVASLVPIRAANGALPRRAPSPRCTADSMRHVWHRCR